MSFRTRTGRVLEVLSGDAGTPWPRDALGRPLPRAPNRGLRIDVTWDVSFDRWSVRCCSRARAVLHGPGEPVTVLRDDWEAWLRARLDEGAVTVHLPGCDIGWCKGCDARHVGVERYRPGWGLEVVE